MDSSLLEQVIAGGAPLIERLSVGQYHRMIESGILREGEPIELIDGLLVRKDSSDAGGNPMTHGPRHALCVKRLQRLDRRLEDAGFHLHSQLPVTLSEFLEPEPDGAVVRGGPEDYEDRHPGPADIRAVIEISDSSLDYDRTTKQRVYAAAEVPLYWIVNLRERQIEVYESPIPSEGRYSRRTDYKPGDAVHLPLSGTETLEIGVEDILP